MSEQPIPDDEILYRRIPPGEKWFEPPDRITSANFKLRKKDDGTKEEGLSVYRANVVSPAEVLCKPDAIPGSRVAWARAGDIRELRGGDKKGTAFGGAGCAGRRRPWTCGDTGPGAAKALRKRF